MSEPAFRYRAFISYSHADAATAAWLHARLERYRVPAHLVGRDAATGRIERRLGRCFRDQAELSAAAHLGETLQQALREAQALIVVCSPASARSRWVHDEIRYFQSLGRGAQIYALIVAGEPHADDPAQECLPAALLVDADGIALPEPLAADARVQRDGRHDAFLKLVAGLIGVGFDELRRREQQRRARQVTLIVGSSLGIAVLMGVLAVVAYQARNEALRAHQLAEQRQHQAEDLLQFMIGDLRGKLEPIGRLSILDAVDRKAMHYFSTLGKTDVSDASLASRSQALRQIGEVRVQQGQLPGALQAFGEALQLAEQLAERHPGRTAAIADVAMAQKWIGEAHYQLGALADARQWWQRSLETARRLLVLEQNQPRWLALHAEATGNLGAAAFAAGDLETAEQHYGAALRMQTALTEHAPEPQYLQSVSELHAWLCSIDIARRDWPRALEHAEAQVAVLQRLVRQSPDNAAYREGLAKAQLNALYNLSEIAPLPPDHAMLREALRTTAALVAQDPDNIEYAMRRMAALNYEVDALIIAMRLDAASARSAELLNLARASQQRAPQQQTTHDYLLAMLAQAVKLALLRDQRATARMLEAEAQQLIVDEHGAALTSAARGLDHALLRWTLATTTAEREAARRDADARFSRASEAGETLRPDLRLRYAVLKGNVEQARLVDAELTSLERGHPFLRVFCAKHPCFRNSAK